MALDDIANNEGLKEADPKASPSVESPPVSSAVSAPSADPTDSVSSTQVALTSGSQGISPGPNPAPVSDTPLVSSPTEASSLQVNEPAPQSPYDELTDKLFARLAPVGTKGNFKMLIYGPPGGAKSSFLNIPNNLVYDQEDGLISIKSWCVQSGTELAPNLMGLPFTSFVQADMLLDRLVAKVPQVKDFEVFSIDTLNDFSNKSLMEIVKREHAQRPTSLNQFVPETEHYTENNNRMMEYVRKLRDLDMNIILLAHAQTVEPRNRPARTYPEFSEKLANKIEAMMDIVGYMEMQDIDGKPTPVMRVQSDGHIHAKSRIPLPAEIANPTYAQLKAEWQKISG